MVIHVTGGIIPELDMGNMEMLGVCQNPYEALDKNYL